MPRGPLSHCAMLRPSRSGQSVGELVMCRVPVLRTGTRSPSQTNHGLCGFSMVAPGIAAVIFFCRSRTAEDRRCAPTLPTA
eukprot:CAMPEP_0204310154 /NCGR_PEP_ID=MMETSP0469-20131031/1534_1 /ASSEMBLY_ACC=CAM_ASM_000384 /TAXON_ID=2969 /ORGANISM="Oxyrrhis marina" /LENGTH=80 /DNA_ID=CAMNT_0051289873 /DNA_START=28 /DNA_END=267 /DNA_ORIENTATION=+